MSKIRVLIVDDAVVVRRFLTSALSGDAALEVVGTAPNGRIALAKIPQVNPDLITLDVEMPEMDGLETLAELRKLYPNLPVIMFSALTERSASATLDALALGANDYVTKPAQAGGVESAAEAIRMELIPKIKALSNKVTRSASRAAPFKPLASGRGSQKPPVRLSSQRIDLVAIGVSTGGPVALSKLVPLLPATFPVPIVIVQHMPPIFTKSLAERLSKSANVPVYEGMAGNALRGGCVWIAAGGVHMVLRRERVAVQVATNQEPPENSCRPSVDVLFRSVAEIYKGHTLAVVLTGMGQDGLRGCEVIREAGGQIIVQDEASSVVWGMPGSIARAGLADAILPLDQLAAEIIRRVRVGRLG